MISSVIATPYGLALPKYFGSPPIFLTSLHQWKSENAGLNMPWTFVDASGRYLRNFIAICPHQPIK